MAYQRRTCNHLRRSECKWKPGEARNPLTTGLRTLLRLAFTHQLAACGLDPWSASTRGQRFRASRADAKDLDRVHALCGACSNGTASVLRLLPPLAWRREPSFPRKRQRATRGRGEGGRRRAKNVESLLRAQRKRAQIPVPHLLPALRLYFRDMILKQSEAI